MKKSSYLIVVSVSLFTLSGIYLTAIGKGNPAYECPDGKTYPVTLTFDDGPNEALTPKVLDVLKAHKVKGTFFVLGEHFPGGKSNPKNASAYALLDREKREGHYIGSHTYHHLAHNTLSAEKARANIEDASKVLDGYLSPILRLPYGAGSFRSKNTETQARNDRVMSLVKGAGFSHVGWDVDTNDWDAKKRPQLVQSMMKQICQEKGGIILFHDIQKNTVDHLNEWIQIIKDQGHSIVGLEHFRPEVLNKTKDKDCVSCTNVKIQNVKELDDLDLMVQKIIREGK